MKKTIKDLFSLTGYYLVKKQKIKPNPNRFEPYECNFMSNTLYVHDYASLELGLYELFEQNIYKFKSKTDAPYIVDCGANLGMSVIYFKSIYPNAIITAFEADPYIFSFLKKNVHSFGFANVEVINKAVWNEDDKKLSFLKEGGAGGRIEEKNTVGDYIEIETVRLKNFLNRKVDFLKIDIEGAEFSVITDCAEELRNVENLFLEYHSFPDRKQNLHDMLDIVQGAGFRYHIKEAFTSNIPFEEIKLNVGMDLQLNIFCYRN